MTMEQKTARSSHGPGGAGEVVHHGTVRLLTRWVGPYGEPEGLADMKRYEVPVGGICSRHVHTGKTEMWLIVQGQAEVWVGGVQIHMVPGDAVRTPAGVSHGLRNIGDEPVVFVNVFEREPDGVVTTREVEEPRTSAKA